MDTVTEQVEEAVKGYNFKGLKIHPWVQDVSPNHPMLYPIYEKAAKLRVPVQFHSGTAPYSTPLQVAEVARTFPEVPVIMGHMGKADLWLDVIPAAELSENIYVDTSGQCIRALIERGRSHSFRFRLAGPPHGCGNAENPGLRHHRRRQKINSGRKCRKDI